MNWGNCQEIACTLLYLLAASPPNWQAAYTLQILSEQQRQYFHASPCTEEVHYYSKTNEKRKMLTILYLFKHQEGYRLRLHII